MEMAICRSTLTLCLGSQSPNCDIQILEGIASVVVGIAVHFIMPDYPTSSKSKFLNEEERLIACNRLALEGIGLTQGAHVKISEWAAFKLTVADWRTWSLCLLFVLGTGSQTIQYFIPSLVQSFGWTGNKAQCEFMALFTHESLKLDG
jgi:hypothetical protein